MNTSIAHFDTFRQEVLKWIGWFGLQDWRVTTLHEKLESDSYAECRFKTVGRIAALVLNKSWGSESVTEVQVRRSAFHECAELWLVTLSELGAARDYNPDEVEKEIHRIIRLLENRVWEGEETMKAKETLKAKEMGKGMAGKKGMPMKSKSSGYVKTPKGKKK